MKRFICLFFLLLPLGAFSQPIIRHALTTNSPSVMTNVVKSMGTGVVATASLNGANITAGSTPNSALQFVAATNGGPVNGANITAGTTPNTALNFVAATNGGPLPAAQLTGSIADARLSANVPLLDAPNVFTGSNYFSQLGGGAATITTVTATTITGDASGMTGYRASNVTSGGVLPAGTLSASTASAGQVLANNGSLRNWTNDVSLGIITGTAGIGSTNIVTGRIVSTNANVSNTSLTLNGAQNGAAGNVLDYTTNNVSKFSVTTSGALTTAGAISSGAALTSGTSISTGAGERLDWTSGARMYSPEAGSISFVSANATTGAKMLLGGANIPSSLQMATNWPALIPIGTNNIGIELRKGTNTAVGVAFAYLTAGSFLMPTNYVAADFVPLAGYVKYCPSNGATYSVTQISTNLISPP